MTTRIKETCALLEIYLHDHLIIGRQAEFSFKEHGYLRDSTIQQ